MHESYSSKNADLGDFHIYICILSQKWLKIAFSRVLLTFPHSIEYQNLSILESKLLLDLKETF